MSAVFIVLPRCHVAHVGKTFTALYMTLHKSYPVDLVGIGVLSATRLAHVKIYATIIKRVPFDCARERVNKHLISLKCMQSRSYSRL